MTRKDGAGEVIEGAVAHSTEVSLPVGLGVIVSVFDDFGGVAVRTFDSFFPSKVPNHFVALGCVDQSVNVQSYRVHEKNASGKRDTTPKL